MLIKKGYQKMTIILIFIVSLGLGSVAVHGESMFTDMKNNHWAYDYVEKVVDLGLMDGYDDGTFRPNDVVNTADALVYVTRLLNASKEEVQAMRERYNPLLSKFELSEKRKDGLAIALSKGLVTEIFVENNLIVNGKIRDATKIELCVYIVKAMGMEKEAEKEVPIFFYKDTDNIPEKARPYVKFLIGKEVIDEKGDGEGKFNPNQSVIRSVLAKMLYLSYNQIDKAPVTIPDKPLERPITENGDYDELVGIFVAKIGDFIIVNNGQKEDSYKLADNAKIVIDGNISTVEELESGMNIKATVSEDNKINYLEVKSTNHIISGTIKEISLKVPATMVVDLKGGEGTKTFSLTNQTKVSIDGKESYLYGLYEGDLVEVEALDSLALNIAAESKDGKVTGVLKDKTFDKEYLLVIEREDKTVHEYTLKRDIIVNRNSNRVTIDDIRRGDRLTLSLTYGEVSSIEAESTEGEDQGYIKAILISEEPTLTISNDRGETISYYMSKDMEIIIDNVRKNIYDLRLGYFAKFKLESDEIVNLEVEKKTDSNEFMGVIEYINPEGRFIVINNETTLQTNNINISPKASIKDAEGRTIQLKDLSIGTKLLIIGNHNTGQFIADKIIVIK